MPLDVICFALKFVGALCVIGGCCSMGCFMCAGLSGRIGALSQLHCLVLNMSGEIGCMAEPLPGMFLHMAAAAGPLYSDFFRSVGRDLRQGRGQTLSAIWNENVDRHLSRGPLKPQDLTMIKRLGERLGTHDTKMQLSYLELFAKELQTTIDKLNSEVDSQKKVYSGLWIMGGLFVVMVFI